MSRKKKIKKPWCIYRHGTSMGIGKILIEYKSSVLALFCEGEDYSPEVCDKKDLWRFATTTAAVKKLRAYGCCDLDELKKALSSHFPSEAKEIAKIKE